MISVCMATYNGEKTIEKQLRSILSQLSLADEVILVDDCSTDNTLQVVSKIIADYAVPVKVCQNKANSGPINSFETALTQAKGDYILLSDQDDEWFPEKVEKILQYFKEGKADLIVHDGIVVDKKGQVMDASWNHFNHNQVTQGVLGTFVKNAFTGAMMACSKRLVKAALPFPKNLEMHDQWLFLAAKKNHMKIAIIDEPLMYYVRHGENVTGMEKRSAYRRAKGRLKMLVKYLGMKKMNSQDFE